VGVIAEETVRITADSSAFKKDVTSGVGAGLKTIGVVAGAAALGGVALLGKGLMDGVKAAAEHQAMLAQLQTGIKSMGGASNVTAGHLVGMSDKIEKMSGVDDLAVQSGESMLLTFGNIKNGVGAGNQVFDEATMAVTDLSVRMGGDMKGAAIQVGKALNDPVKGVSALTRVGVSFTEGQKASIKAMVAHGNTAGAQKLILGELQKEFGGAAKAAGGTMAGQVNILKAHLEDLEQSIGEKILPILMQLVAWAIANWPRFAAVAGQAVRVLISVWTGSLLPALKTGFAVMKTIVTVLAELIGWLNQNRDVAAAVGAAIGVMAAGFVIWTAAVKVASIATKAYAAIQAILNVTMMGFPVILIVVGIAALVAALILLYTRCETARNIMNAAFEVIKTVATTAMAVIRSVITVAIDFVLAHWKEVWGVLAPFVTTALNVVVTLITGWVNVIKGVIAVFRAMLAGDWGAAWTALVGIVTTILNTIKTVIVQIITGIGPSVLAGATAIGTVIWTGIKTVVTLLPQLPGLVIGLLTTALTAVATAELTVAKLIAEAIWNGIKTVAGLLGALGGILTGAVGSAINSATGAATGAAGRIASAIWNGIKTVGEKMAGLGNLLMDKVSAGIQATLTMALGMARGIGAAIKDGIINGLGDIAGAIGDKVNAALDKGRALIAKANIFGSPSKLWADTIGKPLGEGVVKGAEDGLALLGPKMTAAIGVMHTKLVADVKKNSKPVGEAFGSWVTAAKGKMDANFDAISASLSAKLTALQAKLATQQAKLTPTESIIKANELQAAAAKLQGDVDAALVKIRSLPAAHAAVWAELLASQAKNMASLQATLQSSKDTAILAGNTFNKGMAAAAADPLALTLISAQKNFDAVKLQFDQGLVTEAAFVASADALDAARLVAKDDANALSLLADYNTYTAAIAQQTAAGTAITTQEAADAAAQAAAKAGFAAEDATAQEGYNVAQRAQLDANLKIKADKERAAKDAAFTALGAHLTAVFQRTQTHLENIHKDATAKFAEMARTAKTGGENLVNMLSDGINGAMPNLQSALTRIAGAIKSYLKISSPTEKGPMSDLDKWWTNLAPTLVGSFDGSVVKAALTDAVTPGGGSVRLGGRGARDAQLSLNDAALMSQIAALIVEIRKSRSGGEGGVTVVATGGADAAVYAARR
jgi:phage-related protein